MIRVSKVWMLLVAGLALGGGAEVQAQTLRGQAMDALDENSLVSQALVKLMDPEGVQVAASLTDEDGWYTLSVPEAGQYRIEAEALGWDPYQSALFEMTGVEGVFRVDLLMTPRPVQIRGVRVDVDRMARMRRSIHLDVGLNPLALRIAPIGVQQLEYHAEMGRTIPDMLKFEAPPGLLIRDQPDYICYEFRQSCLPMYLNGMRANATDFSRGIPLELLAVVVILTPGESMAYPAGAVLLYSEAWIG